MVEQDAAVQEIAPAGDSALVQDAEVADKAPESQAESAQSEESGEKSTEESNEGQPKKHGGGFQKRIDQLTRANYELRGQLQQAISRLDQIGQQQAKPAGAVDTSTKPDEGKYSTYGEYLEALAEWKATQKIEEQLKRRETQQRQEQIRSHQQERAIAFEEQCESVRSELPDFDEVAFAPDLHGKIPPLVIDAIQESDIGPKVLYHLASNRAELVRISKLPPIAQAKEIGRLEAKLQQAKPKQSATPAPIKPIRGGDAPANGLDDKLSIDEWMKRRNKEARAS